MTSVAVPTQPSFGYLAPLHGHDQPSVFDMLASPLYLGMMCIGSI